MMRWTEWSRWPRRDTLSGSFCSLICAREVTPVRLAMAKPSRSSWGKTTMARTGIGCVYGPSPCSAIASTAPGLQIAMSAWPLATVSIELAVSLAKRFRRQVLAPCSRNWIFTWRSLQPGAPTSSAATSRNILDRCTTGLRGEFPLDGPVRQLSSICISPLCVDSPLYPRCLSGRAATNARGTPGPASECCYNGLQAGDVPARSVAPGGDGDGSYRCRRACDRDRAHVGVRRSCDGALQADDRAARRRPRSGEGVLGHRWPAACQGARQRQLYDPKGVARAARRASAPAPHGRAGR